jgi:Zinc carboxypeptidase
MKKSIVTLFLFLFVINAFAQEKDIYATYFKDPDKITPVPIITGSNYYSSYNSVNDFLKKLAEKHPDVMTISYIGDSQRGYKTPMVTLNKKNGNNKKVRVTYLACVHGDEPISTDAMLNVIYELVENSAYSSYLDKATLMVVPIVNVDGHKDENRFSNDGTDLNRNLGILNVPETVNVKNAINTFDPQVVVDFHEYNPGRKDFLDIDDCLTSAYDAMFLYTGTLNVDANIRKMIETNFVEPTKLVLEKNNRVVRNYSSTQQSNGKTILNIGGATSRSSATNYALQNRISILMEIRGVTEKDKAVKRRIETSTLTALSYLKISNDLSDDILKVVDNANKTAIEGKNEIIVTSKPQVIESNFQFVNTCTNEKNIYNFEAKNNIEQTPQILRPRPDGYVIVTKSKPLFNALKSSGIEFSVVEKATKLEVDTYVQTTDDQNKFEIKKEMMEIPSGSILISSHQKMGNTVVDLLEPEGNNSLYHNSILKTLSGSKTLRLFRVNLSQIVQLQN